MFSEIKSTDIMIALATILGPILAVQIQKLLESSREIRLSRMRIFKTLMATRAQTLSPGHVEAINAVPIEFYGHSKGLKCILSKWQAYYSHLLINANTQVGWSERRFDLLNQLLLSMAQYLGYKFNEMDIKNVYIPEGHVSIGQDQEIIRKGLTDLFKGEISLPISIKEIHGRTDPTIEQK